MSKLDRIMSKQDDRMAKVRAEHDRLTNILFSNDTDPFLKKLARYALPKILKRYQRMQRARKQLYKQLKEREDD